MHIKKCPGKSTFISKKVALQAIRRTLLLGGGIQLAVASISVKGGRMCLQAWLPFRTGYDRLGYAVYGCKVVISATGWIITAYPI